MGGAYASVTVSDGILVQDSIHIIIISNENISDCWSKMIFVNLNYVQNIWCLCRGQIPAECRSPSETVTASEHDATA